MAAPQHTAADDAGALDALLQRFVAAQEDAVVLCGAMIDFVRPRNARDGEAAAAGFRHLYRAIDARDDYRAAVRNAVLELLGNRRAVSLFTEAGILPPSGFFSELWRRIAHRALPDLPDTTQTKDCLPLIFYRRDDHLWFEQIPIEDRQAFWHALRIGEDPGHQALDNVLPAILEALRVLGYQVAASGVDPQFLRVCERASRGDSPFMALAAEADRFVASYREALAECAAPAEDEKHLLVLVSQCVEMVADARRTAATLGTNLRLTYLLVRLQQMLERAQLLAELLGSRFSDAFQSELVELWARFTRDAIGGVIRRDSIRDHFESLIGLLALRVVENAGKTGEHYIADSRAEYWGMWRAAGGAGLIIAVMALLKTLASKLVLAPLQQAFVYSMNYSLGFMLIHSLGFTIATKQPALTAATLAAQVSVTRGRLRELAKLADLIIAMVRSQVAAIFGNVMVAFPVAVLVSLALDFLWGMPPVAPEKAFHLLADLDPLRSGAIPHAAIAGVYLFLAGLISGYFDNHAAYNRLAPRVAALPWLRRAAGDARARVLGELLARNLGGLTGNFFFGIFLGSTGTLGQLLGLPLDIRHIAFAAANLGYALVALDFSVPTATLAWAALGVALIGLTNLGVSFALALWVALRARGVYFGQSRELMALLWKRLRTQPGAFLLPPRGEAERA